jgi:heat shock protein HslJ
MFFRKFSLSSLLAAAFAIVLAACGGTQPGGQTGGSPSLAGTAWQLSTLLGQPPIEGSEVTLSFQDGEVGGRAGCNSFGGQFSVGNDGSLNFQNLYNTEMFCMEPEGVMDQELAFLQTLSQASSYSITNDTLELKNAAGETILSFARQ